MKSILMALALLTVLAVNNVSQACLPGHKVFANGAVTLWAHGVAYKLGEDEDPLLLEPAEFANTAIHIIANGKLLKVTVLEVKLTKDKKHFLYTDYQVQEGRKTKVYRIRSNYTEEGGALRSARSAPPAPAYPIDETVGCGSH